MSRPPRPARSCEAPGVAPMVGVVVLNWNCEWLTRRCIESVARSTHPHDRLRIVLVDNGSVDGSLEALRSWLDRSGSPAVEVVANEANLGFAEGCNRGIRALLGDPSTPVDWVALLNNDAWCEPDWITEMLAVGESHDRVGAVASKLLLDPGFVALDVDGGSSSEHVERVELSPERGPVLEVTGAIRTAGFSDEGALMWPARRLWQLPAGGHGRIWVPAGPGRCEVTVALCDSDGRSRSLEASFGEERTMLLNGLGTGVNDSGEGYDIGYGVPDTGADVSPAVPGAGEGVGGFCGGAALLSAEALREVGLFDPRFFAYYEDTDLSWRLRRAGWEIRVAPRAVVHHAFGASGGGGSRLHVFLDRRNWLLTNVRNGDSRDLRRSLGWLRRGAWRLFRVNVFGRVRRARKAQWQPLITWKLAAVSALVGSPRARLLRRPGVRSTGRVRSVLQPRSRPPKPVPVPGGPLVVYLDVGETLKAGYRAGIQRVVCRLAAELPFADPQVQLVAIRRCERNNAFRRLSSAEYESLLRSGAEAPPEGSPATESAKASLRALLSRLGVISGVRRLRELLFGRSRRALEDSLVLDRLAPGAVLLEIDAVWNDLDVDRGQLLAELRRSGVHVATFVHDLFPMESPEWFSSELRGIFVPAVTAQLRNSELVLCATPATAEQIRRVCDRDALGVPEVAVVPLGADPPGAGNAPAGSSGVARTPAVVPAGDRYLLMVGTVESRKNHALALEVFERLARRFADLHLVVVGRYGWGAEDVVSRLRSHDLAGTRLHWLAEVDDLQLESLYAGAHSVLVPSLAEGFGLPVAEGLLRGVPVIASDHGALVSVGGTSATYLPDDVPEVWEQVLASRLTDPTAQSEAVRAAAGFDPPTWADSASSVASALREHFSW